MIEHTSCEHFSDDAREALLDEGLRGALEHATGLFAERREKAMAEVPDWEELRERARAIKLATLDALDEHLRTFAERAERAGAQVHWARTAREGCEIVARIAEGAGAKRLVKSKSMTTEEMGLNHALERRGIEPVETDLGEWIIQLAGETPSHIIVPAIHKTRRQVAELFAEKLSIEPGDDPAELTRAAREVLRRHFAEAELGVSGVNFGVVETGSILVLENEGNARMCTSLPRVHVAVMGIEKLVPRLADLEVFLRLLPRSGTGQHLTSYQSILTGPPDREGEEGPAELHIVLLDNGRSAMLGDAACRESLACIRCGACLNACPVYRQIGGHAYGSVYPGPIGIAITPQLAGIERAGELPFASSLCGACRDVCPVKIDIPSILLDLRSKASRLPAALPGAPGSLRPLERLAFRLWSWAMSGPRRYRALAFLGRLAQRLGLRPGRPGPLARRLAPPLAAWTAGRELPGLARRPFRDRWREELSRPDEGEAS